MKRVFVLEDGSERIEEIEQALSRAEVTVATSFDEAVAAFRPPYDLICLDHDLGSVDTARPEIRNTGYEFVLWLPRATNIFRPKVILHTHSASGGEAMARELRVKGFKPVLAPFGDEMLEKARRILRQR